MALFVDTKEELKYVIEKTNIDKKIVEKVLNYYDSIFSKYPSPDCLQISKKTKINLKTVTHIFDIQHDFLIMKGL